MPLRLANPAAMEAPLRRGLRLCTTAFDTARLASSVHALRTHPDHARAQPRASRPPAPAGARVDAGTEHDRTPRGDAGPGADQSLHRALVPARGIRGRGARGPDPRATCCPCVAA